MKRLILTTALAAIPLLFLLPASRADRGDQETRQKYRLDFRGKAGVQMRLLLVTKPTARANPERREEIITVPAQIDFEASRCWAWVDTLPDGKSGSDGDECDVHLLKDGHPYGSVEFRIKKQIEQSGGVGDL